MKPAPPNRANGNVRAIRSLYVHNSTAGAIDRPLSKVGDRKSVFKVPANGPVKRISTIQNKTIQRPRDNTQNTFGMSKGITPIRPTKVNASFLRPPGDIFSIRKAMLERTVRIGERSKTGNPGNHSMVSNASIMKMMVCTPKNNGLRQVYQKFVGSERKSAVKSMATTAAAAAAAAAESPFVGKEFREETVQNLGTLNVGNDQNENFVPLKNCIIKNAKKLNLHDETITDELEENRLPETKFSSPKNESTPQKVLPLLEGKADIDMPNNGHGLPCPLSSIVEEYQSKMLSKDDALISIVDDLERVVAFCSVSSKFWEFQKQKRELYREMVKLEDELEEAVRKNVDIQAKFKEYRQRLKELLKERAEVRDTFTSTLNLMLHNYEEEETKARAKPFVDLGEILSELSKPTKKEGKKENKEEEAAMDVEIKEKPVLRRSLRLRGTPKALKKEVKKTSMCLRSSGKREVKQEEFVIKSSKRKIQSSIYRDLQKSFNLCSPESSF